MNWASVWEHAKQVEKAKAERKAADERKQAERRATVAETRWVLTAVGDGMKSRWNFDGEAEARAKYAERVERGDSAVALYRLDPTLVATIETEAGR